MSDAEHESAAAEAASGGVQQHISTDDSAIESSSIEAPPVDSSGQGEVAQAELAQSGGDVEGAADAGAVAGGESGAGEGEEEEVAVDAREQGEATGGEEEEGLDAGEVAAADAGAGDDPDAAAKAAAALKIQRIGRGKIVRQQDRQALAASSTVTKAEAREERQRQIAERKAKASAASSGSSGAQPAVAADAAAGPPVETKKAATLDDIIDLAPLLTKPELGEWNRDLVSLEHAVTFDVMKRGNLKMIDEHTVRPPPPLHPVIICNILPGAQRVRQPPPYPRHCNHEPALLPVGQRPRRGLRCSAPQPLRVRRRREGRPPLHRSVRAPCLPAVYFL
jgi:hypothetical protein